MAPARTSRRETRRRNHREVRPTTEGLESRLLLYSTLGGQFTYGSRITYSFAPDGTDIGGVPSALYERMNELGVTESTWKDQFRKAAATWESIANINLVEVSDNGDPFSVAGNQQNDTRFGDIRIGGTPQGDGVLGLAFLPPDYNGGTLAGDIVMNTATTWHVNSDVDIMSVAIHEIGHSLGLDHSTLTSAVMYPGYTGVKQSLNSDDVAGMREVYQARAADGLEGPLGNNIYQRATNISSYIDASAQIHIPSLDITTTSDTDWFYVKAPANTTGNMTVSMQSSNLSSLSPRIIVYNTLMQVQGSQSAPNAFGATVSVTVSNVYPGKGFYIRAQAANSGPTGAGGYGLLANFGTAELLPISPPDTTVLEQPSQGGGSISLTDPDSPYLTTKVGNIDAFAEVYSIDNDRYQPGGGRGRNHLLTTSLLARCEPFTGLCDTIMASIHQVIPTVDALPTLTAAERLTTAVDRILEKLFGE